MEEKHEGNKTKGNSCLWRCSVKQIKERNDQKIELRGVSRGIGRRGRNTDTEGVITLFTIISCFIS